MTYSSKHEMAVFGISDHGYTLPPPQKKGKDLICGKSGSDYWDGGCLGHWDAASPAVSCMVNKVPKIRFS